MHVRIFLALLRAAARTELVQTQLSAIQQRHQQGFGEEWCRGRFAAGLFQEVRADRDMAQDAFQLGERCIGKMHFVLESRIGMQIAQMVVEAFLDLAVDDRVLTDLPGDFLQLRAGSGRGTLRRGLGSGVASQSG
ncbi:hypothetical protein [Paracidovorax anthurii]|uniref:hypothetical protein n=1 Tax=Paracidovorax anthurii TaxID=78229 RepID=UPI0011BF7F8F|nr:hypothetical protein [Paracidovorax anthurii]